MNTSTALRTVLIVDDELPALTNMQCVLAGSPGWRLAGSCRSSAQAREVMAREAVDLILLDIEMPGQSGLEFARELCVAADAPLIVFITAYDQHAVSAFDVFALDYLLKPFDDERFGQMLVRAERSLALRRQAGSNAGLGDYLRDRAAFDAGQPAPWLEQLVVRSVGSTERIAVDDILWIGAAANYVEVHLAARVVLHRTTITSMASRLPPDQFIRLHRTAIARRSAMQSLQVTADGNHQVRLSNGDCVRVSSSYVKDVQKLFI
jgi:two-component system, LytTR family, response regulator